MEETEDLGGNAFRKKKKRVIKVKGEKQNSTEG